MKKFNYQHIKKSTIVPTLLLILCFSTIALNFCILQSIISQKNNSFGENANLIEEPKLSAQEINITTPENKTYTAPMSGYYPGTFGFENDDLGIMPEGWTGNANIITESEFNNHKNIVTIHDTSSGVSYTLQSSDHFPRSYGTIEMWVRIDDARNDDANILTRDSTNVQDMVRIKIKGDKWMYNDGTDKVIPNVADPQDNTWHHVRIDFRCHNAGPYLGISDDRYIATIDGVSSGELNFTNSNNLDFGMLYFVCSTLGVCEFSIDAIGYSWDPNYNIGDNLNEGLLLSFDTSFTPDWLGYSLDGQVNKTILGNVTFPMPLDGSHDIQVFGNNSVGTKYESDIRYFSVDPITIMTPENKTYSRPMSGYYPAIYGFENDEDGTDPEMWTITGESGGCTAQVISDFNGHNKVLEFHDVSGTYKLEAGNSVNAQDYGIIEVWMAISDASSGAIKVAPRASNNSFALMIRSNKFEYHDDIGWHDVGKSAQSNTWYHIKIEFETTTGNYMDLSQWRWRAYINGEQYGDYSFEFNEVPNKIMLISDESCTNYYGYFDAVGYSWDPNYNIGDNRKEGLLLSFDTSFTPDWLGYSLDGQANKTILGNTTFPMPTNGHYAVQVFGNDSVGIMHESDVRQFLVEYVPIKIITPENKTYYGPMSGYYPATCGFESDADGSDPSGWAVDESGGTITVVDDVDRHNKVVELYDTSGSVDVELYQTFSAKNQGSIELYVYNNDASKRLAFNFGDSTFATNIFRLRMDNYKFEYVDNTGWHDVGKSASSLTWYHIIIHFERTTSGYQGLSQNKWKIEINGIEYGDYNFVTNADLEGFKILTRNPDSGYSCYVDAVGFSWDPNYNIGDNRYEGLLLSFENIVSLDWIGYSLDGQTNRTILGNTTFPIPLGALHNIQVFGNDSIGIKYESEVRYFTIYELPKIFIKLPIQNDLFESSAPDYNISITVSGLNKTWYTLDNGATNITFTGLTGTINQVEWDKKVDGAITIQFYANDTLGYKNSTEVVVIKDTTAPIISIDIPYANDFFAENSPSFNLTIDELSLNTTWYTFDSGITNITFTGLTGIINQTEWDNQNEGPITIRFYASDMFRRMNYAEITINKDITDPVITIHSPSIGEEFEVIPPPFSITVDEFNFESMWYTIDGGLNNYSITQFTGYIDSTAWNAVPIGAITIRFYAKDKAGNMGYADVIVQKSFPPLPSEEESEIVLIIIIGFSVGIGAIGSVTVGFVYYKRKRQIFIGEKKPKVKKPAKPRRVKRTRTRKEKITGELSLMSCPFCQNVIKGDLKYCTFCGAKLEE